MCIINSFKDMLIIIIMTYNLNINNNSNMIIRFKLDNDAPEDFILKWIELKNKCETWTKTDTRKETIESWLKYCKISTNKNLPFLDRSELGIGGNDNNKYKQIRFRQRIEQKPFDDNDIVIDQIYNTDHEKWNLEELHDLINAFNMFAEDYMNSKGGINGFIEFKINSEFNYQDDSPDDNDLKSKLKNELINTLLVDHYNNDKIYVLEVVKFISNSDGPEGWIKKGGKTEHIGYMKAKFKTKDDACSYYDRHNPHLRKLNAHETFKSDWDSETKLFYIVREDYHLIDNIPPFSKDDLPINGSYKYLK